LSTAAGAKTGTTADRPLLILVSIITVVVCVAAVGVAGRRGSYVSAAAMGAAAGLAQGSAGLQGKGLGGLLVDHGLMDAIVPALSSPYPYLYALGWAVGIVLFQTSLQRSRASISAPLANVVGNVFTVLCVYILLCSEVADDTDLTD